MQRVTDMKKKVHPIFATQFHPEKNAFEKNEPYDKDDFAETKQIHSQQAIKVMGELAFQFIAYCQKYSTSKNLVKIMNETLYENELTIENFAPTKAAKLGFKSFTSVYVWGAGAGSRANIFRHPRKETSFGGTYDKRRETATSVAGNASSTEGTINTSKSETIPGLRGLERTTNGKAQEQDVELIHA